MTVNVKIKHVAASQDHVLVVADDGRCYGWGSNEYGKLGIDSTRDSISEPCPNRGMIDHKVVMCAAGRNHSLFLTKMGQVFSAGLNDFG